MRARILLLAAVLFVLSPLTAKAGGFTIFINVPLCKDMPAAQTLVQRFTKSEVSSVSELALFASPYRFTHPPLCLAQDFRAKILSLHKQPDALRPGGAMEVFLIRVLIPTLHRRPQIRYVVINSFLTGRAI